MSDIKSVLTKAKKAKSVKQAKKGHDFGKPGKNFDKIAAKAGKKYDSKESGEKVAGSIFWKQRSK